jgi:GNAT superfamily N-acetyltransferase
MSALEAVVGRKVSAGTVASGGDRADYGRLLQEQRRWIEDELGLRVAELQPSAVAEYADPFRYYRDTGTVPLLARVDHDPAGIAALKPCDSARRVVELKRVYVRPEARGHGVGRVVVRAAVDAAVRMGAGRVVLETHEEYMKAAVRLYRSVGFRETDPLGVTHHPDVLSMVLDLAAGPGGAEAQRRGAAHRVAAGA